VNRQKVFRKFSNNIPLCRPFLPVDLSLQLVVSRLLGRYLPGHLPLQPADVLALRVPRSAPKRKKVPDILLAENHFDNANVVVFDHSGHLGEMQ
jgi:hypothetical protein